MKDVLLRIKETLVEDEQISLTTTSAEDICTLSVNFIGINVLLCVVTSRFILVESPFTLDSTVTFGNTMIYDLQSTEEVSEVVKSLCVNLKTRFKYFEDYKASVECSMENRTEFTYPSQHSASNVSVALTVKGFSIDVSSNGSINLTREELQVLENYSRKLETQINVSLVSPKDIKSLSKITCFS